MDDVLERLQTPARQVDLDRGATKTRVGFINCILGKPARHLPTDDAGFDLVELDEAVQAMTSGLTLAIRHFDHMSANFRADADLFDVLQNLIMDAARVGGVRADADAVRNATASGSQVVEDRYQDGRATVTPIPLADLRFGPRSHASAIWWLGLLYRRPLRFKEVLAELPKRQQKVATGSAAVSHPALSSGRLRSRARTSHLGWGRPAASCRLFFS